MRPGPEPREVAHGGGGGKRAENEMSVRSQLAGVGLGGRGHGTAPTQAAMLAHTLGNCRSHKCLGMSRTGRVACVPISTEVGGGGGGGCERQREKGAFWSGRAVVDEDVRADDLRHQVVRAGNKDPRRVHDEVQQLARRGHGRRVVELR